MPNQSDSPFEHGIFRSSSISTLLAAKTIASQELLQPSVSETFSAMAALNPIASPSATDNIVAVGLGEKVVRGICTGIPAVKVFVRVKFASNDIGDDDRIPLNYGKVPVDVEQIGTVRAFRAAAQAAPPNPRVMIRPARPGCSIGFIHPNGRMAGTFGALVTNAKQLFVLSNNHVIADENALAKGADIVQPGTLDGGTSADAIAKLTDYIELQTVGNNKVDAAIAEVLDPKMVSRDILGIGAPTGTVAAKLDMIVEKFGRTTSYRAGRVISVATDVKVGYGMGVLSFEDQIVIQGLGGQQFSAAGDSGSLILERDTNRATGLLFAGSSTHTIANHIADVLAAFNVSLA